MRKEKKVGLVCAMIFVALSAFGGEARADHRHQHSGASFGISLPNLGIYVGPGGVSVGGGGVRIDTRNYRSPYSSPYQSPYHYNPGYGYQRPYCPPGHSVPYNGRQPYQYVPPVTTYPRPYDTGDYQRRMRDYQRQQEEIRRAQERYQRDLERIQRQYNNR